MTRLARYLARLWCDHFHGGGDIKRDSADRINWQCRRCGRWADSTATREPPRGEVEQERDHRPTDSRNSRATRLHIATL